MEHSTGRLGSNNGKRQVIEYSIESVRDIKWLFRLQRGDIISFTFGQFKIKEILISRDVEDETIFRIVIDHEVYTNELYINKYNIYDLDLRPIKTNLNVFSNSYDPGKYSYEQADPPHSMMIM